MLGLASATPARAAEPPRPNVVLILADDLGYGDVGFLGCQDIPTPHMDQLARDGVRFANGYVCSAVCAPSRAGLLTGRQPARLGITANHQPLPPGEITLASELKEQGYATALIGKWHLGGAEHEHPLRRGFDEFYGFLGYGISYFQPEGYYTDVLTDKAVDFIDRHRKEPFFLYLAYNAPHAPMEASAKYLDRVAGIKDPMRRVNAAMISALDDGIGRVLAALDEHALASNTLVVFLSDNGAKIDYPGHPDFRGQGASNGPLRAGKYWIYEGGVRVPFVMRWPGVLPGGSVYEPLVSSLDLFPSILAAAGRSLRTDREYDGVNLLPELRKTFTNEKPRALAWRADSELVNARRPWVSIRHADWKLHLYQRDGGETVELFNLASDPGETHNLAADRPEVVRELRATLATDVVSHPEGNPPASDTSPVRQSH